jgi:1,6-anhydro-N-acetylmuramate kinase
MNGIEVVHVHYTQNNPSDPLRMELLNYATIAHSPIVKERVMNVINHKVTTSEQIAQINYMLGETFAYAVLSFCESRQIDLATQVDLISSHGQRLWHLPLPDLTDASDSMRTNLEMAEMAIISARTGKTTVTNFCVGEQAYGRQGAPLFGVTKALMLVHPTHSRACQSLGDIATVCFIPADDVEGYYEFDIGPGMLLINTAVGYLTDGQVGNDNQGAIARTGTASQYMVDEFLASPYFAHGIPKTCGMENFNNATAYDLCERMSDDGFSVEDCIATLTRITAQSIVDGYRTHAPRHGIDEMFVYGEGSSNPVILNYIKEEMPAIQIKQLDETGIPGAANEAIAVAQLGLDCVFGRPSIVPQRVETRAPAVIGQIQPGRNWRNLVQRVAMFWEGERLDGGADCVMQLEVIRNGLVGHL